MICDHLRPELNEPEPVIILHEPNNKLDAFNEDTRIKMRYGGNRKWYLVRCLKEMSSY